ncbi:MAG: sulfite exporter TauE/SafE family protein, partial [Thermoleophilia bacterium]|nr:sulfite exporter TauE/SafE family protein [Thermoleophilia bacterium]
MPTLIVLIVVGFLAQLVDGALGMAYGATSSTLLLAVGLSPATASASVHLAELGTTAAAGISHWRFGNVDWRTVRRIGIPGAIGAFVGAVVLSSVSAELARPWMSGVLLALGVYILCRFTLFGVPKPRGRRYVRGRYLAPLGLGAGFLDATGGGGWGPVTTPTILATGKYEPRKVIGSVDTSEFLVALAASVGFLLALGSQGVAWTYVAALLIGGVAAAPLAAWLVRHVTPALLGASVGGLILVTNTRTLVDVYALPERVSRPLYLALCSVWARAATIVVRRPRRSGQPLL